MQNSKKFQSKLLWPRQIRNNKTANTTGRTTNWSKWRRSCLSATLVNWHKSLTFPNECKYVECFFLLFLLCISCCCCCCCCYCRRCSDSVLLCFDISKLHCCLWLAAAASAAVAMSMSMAVSLFAAQEGKAKTKTKDLRF